MSEADPLLAYRDRFPILRATNYLISNSLGPVPAETREALVDYYETWAARGVRAWEEGWWALASDVGDDVAPLLGAGPGEVTFQPCVTLAHEVVFSAFDFDGPRRKVVTDAMHFPSILYLIDGLRSRGAEVVVVPSDDGVSVDGGRIIEQIDETTALVCLSHVLFKSAFVHDIAAIAGRSREVGATTVIDGYQSVGAIPVEVRALGVDIYIGGCLKWLCGGPGNAFLWVDPSLAPTLAPRTTGWMSHRRPFGFEPAHDRRDDSWRFLHGTPSIPALYAARPGLRIVREVGAGAIRAKSIRQTSRLIGLAEEAGLRVTAPRDSARRGGTVAIDVDEGRAVSMALKAREIVCDYRPGAGVRLSPHFFTSDDEIEAAVAAIVEIRDRGAWRAFAEKGGAVT